MGFRGYVNAICDDIRGNERVVDIGCLGSFESSQLKRHDEYRKSAGSILGVDINLKWIKRANELGYDDIVYCDITSSSDVDNIVKKYGKFDHLICTDLIEHVSNPGQMMDGLMRMMNDDARIYITTPNVKSITYIAMFLEKIPYKINFDHMFWFDVKTLRQFLNRHGFKDVVFNYYGGKKDREMAKLLNVKWQDKMGRRIYVVCKRI